MTNDPMFMFQFIEKREVFWMRERRELGLELERHGVDAEAFVSYSEDDRNAAIARAYRELRPGIHWSGESAATTSMGTQVAVCKRAMEVLALKAASNKL